MEIAVFEGSMNLTRQGIQKQLVCLFKGENAIAAFLLEELKRIGAVVKLEA